MVNSHSMKLKALTCAQLVHLLIARCCIYISCYATLLKYTKGALSCYATLLKYTNRSLTSSTLVLLLIIVCTNFSEFSDDWHNR